MITAYIALGSNLGDRLQQLRLAVGALGDAAGVTVESRSPIYETEAVATLPQPDYLNAVVRVATSHSARSLLDLCLGIEQSLGRQRPVGQTKAARTIDLDLILYGNHVYRQPGMEVPHPGLLVRPFVRVPLADVAEPRLVHPQTGEALDRFPLGPGMRLYHAALSV